MPPQKYSWFTGGFLFLQGGKFFRDASLLLSNEGCMGHLSVALSDTLLIAIFDGIFTV